MTHEEKRILIKAISHYGMEKQKIVAIEEMSELTKEICKSERGTLDLEHLSEEIADVEIMLEQLKIMYCTGGKVDHYVTQKIERLKQRMGQGD